MATRTRAAKGFGVLLQRYRAAAGLTQEELAERASVSGRAISDLERGVKTRPRPYTVRQLADALDLSPIDRAVFLDAANGDHDSREPSIPIARGLSLSATLPTPPTPFVGRVEEIAAVSELLSHEHIRLLTLTGAGGSGKTRLAIEVTRRLAPRYAGGAFFVRLAPIRDSALVVPTIANALGIQERRNIPLLDALMETIPHQAVLLVLDNFEHVMAAAGEIGHVLTGCPAITVLTTSRAPLHLYAEHEYPVRPMPVPQLQSSDSWQRSAEADAVRLFVDRARAVNPRFELTEENIASIVDICARVDGLPLAIELAAGRVRMFPTSDLAARLNYRLPLLTGGPRDQPERQQTLRSTIDWSYNLLNPAERQLFARLSIFVGGCTFDAIEDVCGGDNGLEVLDGVTTLVEHHLLQKRGADQEPRYVMLETIREYAAMRLAGSGEGEDIQRRHARHYFSLTVRTVALYHTPAASRALDDRIERELGNLRAAFEWFMERDAESALRLCRLLVAFWRSRGRIPEGRQWLDRALHLDDGVPEDARADAYWAAGSLALNQGDAPAAVSLLTEALRLFRQIGDVRAIATTLAQLGPAFGALGDLEKESVLLEEALSLGRQASGEWAVYVSLLNLAEVRRRQGDLQQAGSLLPEAIVMGREGGNLAFVSSALVEGGCIALAEGDLDRAEALYREGCTQGYDVGFFDCVPPALDGLAEIAMRRGEIERAVLLGGASCALREQFALEPWPADRLELEGHRRLTRECLNGATWEDLWQEGRAMSLEQVVAYAQQEVPHTSPRHSLRS